MVNFITNKLALKLKIAHKSFKLEKLPIMYIVVYTWRKIEQRVCLKLCVSNEIMSTESLKLLQKCFG